METKEKKVEADDKNVRINAETFAEVKNFCEKNGMKINWFFAQAAKLYLLELEEAKESVK